MDLNSQLNNEAWRNEQFPVSRQRIFLAHAGVATLPRVAAAALERFARTGSQLQQESIEAWKGVAQARTLAAKLLGCTADEMALLGPTALGLNLVANGLDWRAGDEVICYMEDYPANVYPWIKLRDQGVTPVLLQPEQPGVLTWDLIKGSITEKTRLVALASCNFLSGYRIDINCIGSELHKRDILFCIDGIQTLGAFPTNVEHVDFLSADSHKWLLGPVGAGIFYVSKAMQDVLKPTLLGSWNVQSPGFTAQADIQFYDGARRYEPGTLNMPGILAMAASMQLLLEFGIDNIAQRILSLRAFLLTRLQQAGFMPYITATDEHENDKNHSGIITVSHPTKDLKELYAKLESNSISASLRQNRQGQDLLRFSPHFYNTEEELARTADLLL